VSSGDIAGSSATSGSDSGGTESSDSGATGVGGSGESAGAAGETSGFGGTSAGNKCSSRNIDVQATVVSGTVTFNGVAITNDIKGVGVVTLVNAAGDRVDLASIPGDAYSTLVAPGTYDLYYNGQSGSVPPSNSHAKLQSGIVVGTEPLSLDVDIPATDVSTTVTFNGVALSDSVTTNSDNSSKGALYLSRGAGERAFVAFLADRTYFARVVPGSYDLYYSRYSRSAEILPTNTFAKLQTGIVIGTSPVSLKVDVPVTTVSATVTVSGAALTNIDDVVSFLTLKSDSGDSVQLTRTSPTGASSAPVIPGTYDLYYRPDGNAPGLPRNRSPAKLMSGIVVGSSPLSLTVDVPATIVSGKVTINGAGGAANAFFGAKILTLRSTAGDQVDLPLDADGSYSMRVIPGTYDVVYDNAQANLAQAPRNDSTKIKSGIVVGSSPLNLDLDIPATTVSGSVTLNGARLNGSVDGDGSVLLLDAAGGQAVLSGLKAGSYSTLVVPGSYDLYYRLSSPGTAVPINTRALFKRGIVVGTSPLSLDVDVPAVTVSGTVTVNGHSIIDPNHAGFGRLTLYGLDHDTGELATTFSRNADPFELSKGAFSALVIRGSYELYYGVDHEGPGVPQNSKLDLGCFNVP